MKKRLVIMNGQKLVETEVQNGWKTIKVEKALGLKPGIYNLYNATQADKSKSYTGVILHSDKENIYQQVGKSYIKHSYSDFTKIPENGIAKSISYNKQGEASVNAEVKQGQRRSL